MSVSTNSEPKLNLMRINIPNMSTSTSRSHPPSRSTAGLLKRSSGYLHLRTSQTQRLKTLESCQDLGTFMMISNNKTYESKQLCGSTPVKTCATYLATCENMWRYVKITYLHPITGFCASDLFLKHLNKAWSCAMSIVSSIFNVHSVHFESLNYQNPATKKTRLQPQQGTKKWLLAHWRLQKHLENQDAGNPHHHCVGPALASSLPRSLVHITYRNYHRNLHAKDIIWEYCLYGVMHVWKRSWAH